MKLGGKGSGRGRWAGWQGTRETLYSKGRPHITAQLGQRTCGGGLRRALALRQSESPEVAISVRGQQGSKAAAVPEHMCNVCGPMATRDVTLMLT
jgi:hypothetical protein